MNLKSKNAGTRRLIHKGFYPIDFIATTTTADIHITASDHTWADTTVTLVTPAKTGPAVDAINAARLTADGHTVIATLDAPDNSDPITIIVALPWNSSIDIRTTDGHVIAYGHLNKAVVRTDAGRVSIEQACTETVIRPFYRLPTNDGEEA